MGRYAKITEKGLNGAFFLALETQLAAGVAGKVGAMYDSNEETETYRGLGTAPAMREWIGGRLERNVPVLEYVLRNRTFEQTLPVSVDDIRRDKTGQILRTVRGMGQRAGEHWDKLLYEADVAGLATVCYDGQYFYDDDHEEGDSGVQKNLLTATEVPALDVTSATAPTADEMADILLGLITYMLGYKDDQGEPINGAARAFLAYVPLNMWSATVHAITAENLSSGQTNKMKGFFEQGYRIDVVPEARSATTTTMRLFRTDGELRPFILQEEFALQTTLIGSGSQEEFKNNRWLFGTKAIRAVGYGLWQRALHATLS